VPTVGSLRSVPAAIVRWRRKGIDHSSSGSLRAGESYHRPRLDRLASAVP
jgi:hypothetical protein